MGRKKIDLKRIECSKERSDKYSKRKNGLLKKAQEIEVLCNIDIALIIFSPKNKANIYHSGSFGKILEKFCKVSLQEREDRRAYTIKTLKKILSMNNTENSTENVHIFHEGGEVIQDDNKITKLRELKELIVEKKLIYRDWKYPEEVNDLNRVNIMENYLISFLSHIGNIIKIKTQEEQQNLI
ncbi:agamous-like MADS-box protein AGL30 [Capsella rubella]|uniref:agamous-like MADS-box protein AGL30 n=1 Tax=Capsella rubella TaxID=81985 RepID=UPI000CD5AFD8|nr:agamous-like MADS-box protein AGL30 [Capsella rubella]